MFDLLSASFQAGNLRCSADCWANKASPNLLLWSLRIHRRKKGGDEPGALEELNVKTWPGFVGWTSWGGVLGVWGTDVNLTWSSAAADRGLPEVNASSRRGQKLSQCSPWVVSPPTRAGVSAGFLQFYSSDCVTGWVKKGFLWEARGLMRCISVFLYSFINIQERRLRDRTSLPQ